MSHNIMKTLKAIKKRVSSSKEPQRRFSKDIQVVRGGYNIDLSHVDDSFSPLHRSCLLNEPSEKVLKIVKTGVNVNQIDQVSGSVALHLGIVNGNLDTVKVLLSHGSDIDLRDGEGKTPLIKAIESGHLIDFLVYSQANPNIPDNEGNTALMWAVQSMDSNAIQVLLDSTRDGISKHHVDVNRRNLRRETALHLIAGKPELNKVLSSILDQQAMLDVQDNQGKTPLIIAVEYGNRFAVQVFLDKGADPSIKDSSGVTAKDMAILKGFKDIEALIQSSVSNSSRLPGVTDQRILLDWSDSDDENDMESSSDALDRLPVNLRKKNEESHIRTQSHSGMTDVTNKERPTSSSFNPVIQELQSLASGSNIQPSSLRKSLGSSLTDAKLVNQDVQESVFNQSNPFLKSSDSEDFDLEPAIIVSMNSSEQLSNPAKTTTNEDFIQNLRDLLDEEIKSNDDIDRLLMNDVFSSSFGSQDKNKHPLDSSDHPSDHQPQRDSTKTRPSLTDPSLCSNDFSGKDQDDRKQGSATERDSRTPFQEQTFFLKKHSFSSSEESANEIDSFDNLSVKGKQEASMHKLFKPISTETDVPSAESTSMIPSFVLFLEDLDGEESSDFKVDNVIQETNVKEDLPIYAETKKKSVTFGDSKEKRVRFSGDSSLSENIQNDKLRSKKEKLETKTIADEDTKDKSIFNRKPAVLSDSQTSSSIKKVGVLPPVKSLFSTRPTPLFFPEVVMTKNDNGSSLAEPRAEKQNDMEIKPETNRTNQIPDENEESDVEAEDFSEEVDEIISEDESIEEVIPGEPRKGIFQTSVSETKDSHPIFPFNAETVPSTVKPVVVEEKISLSRSPSRLSSKESFDEVIRLKELYEREKAFRSRIEHDLEEAKKTTASATHDYHSLLKTKIELEEKCFRLESSNSRTSFTIEQLKTENIRLQHKSEVFEKQVKEIEELRRERQDLQSEVMQVEQEVARLREQLSKTRMSALNEENDKQVKDLLESNSELSQQNQSLKKELALKESQIMRMRSEFDSNLQSINHQLESVQQDRDYLKVQLQHIHSRDNFESTSFPLKKSYEQTNADLVKTIKDLNQAIDKLNQRTSLLAQQQNQGINSSPDMTVSQEFLSKDLVYPSLVSGIPGDRRPKSLFVQNLLHLNHDKNNQGNFYESKNNLDKEINILKKRLGIVCSNIKSNF